VNSEIKIYEIPLKETFRRYKAFIITISFGFAICLGCFLAAVKIQINQERLAFRTEAQSKRYILEQSLAYNLQQVQNFRRFLSVAGARPQYIKRFATPLIQSEFDVIMWVPHSKKSGPYVFSPALSIEKNSTKFSQQDVLSKTSEIEDTMQLAVKIKQSVSMMLVLNSEKNIRKQYLLVIAPIFSWNFNKGTVSESDAPKGFIVAAFSLDDFFTKTFGGDEKGAHIAALISDKKNPEHSIFVNGLITDFNFDNISELTSENLKQRVSFYYEAEIDAFRSRWLLTLVPSSEYSLRRTNMGGPWAVLFLAILFLAVLGVFLFYLIHSKELVQAEVVVQTFEVRKQKALLQLILEDLDSGVIVVDRQGQFVLFNQSAKIIAGAKESLDINSWPDECQIFYADQTTLCSWEDFLILKMFRDNSEAEEGEFFVSSGGNKRRIRVNCRSIRDLKGNLQGALAILIDITEKVETAETLAKTSQEAQRLAAIVEYSNDAIFAKTLDGIITSWNPAAEKLYGYSADEMIGKPVDILIPKHMPNEEVEIISKIRSGKRINHYETTRVRKDGIEINISFTISPIKLPDGKIIGASSIARDITEVIRSRKALEEKAKELARSNSELERFAYIASHDLQEPLRTVSSFGTLLKSEYQSTLNSEAQEYVMFMIDAASRMQHLIEGLLAYSRVEKTGNRFTEIDLNELLTVALQNLKATIDRNKATIVSDMLPTLVVDGEQMVQLFQNLIGNAVKFRAAESPVIKIKAEEMEDTWRFYVEDNGIGIEPQYFTRIFEIFQKLHTKEEYHGSGIGLSICKKIVERHLGRIWADSVKTGGLRIYFEISKELQRENEERRVQIA
jgi:PAS domain S-box-containing protein